MSARLLAMLLADPASADRLDGDGWNGVIAAARAERLIGSLAVQLRGLAIPAAVARVLADAAVSSAAERTAALWEAEVARRVLAPLGVPVVLLKGSAYVAAGLDAGRGRSIGDLDILVSRASLDAAEAALLDGGWEWVKPDPYDDAYYRRWMHELPPMVRIDSDRMIDVHHTILPPTARPTPDAAALVAEAVPLENGLFVLCPEDMVVHAAAHLLADGDLAGGLRNLWDIDRLVREFAERDAAFVDRLMRRAARHELAQVVARALRLAKAVYATPVAGFALRAGDRWFLRRLLARDGWGRSRHRGTAFAFYVRSHWLRMPPLLLARHLWVKWRRG
ncbi:nucleotidyltransferase family protein [Sphingomonas sp. VNH70]|uniref:nucleotidyltransferase domain-containing protein n=1 Tax=Sphingomonas silueang TaxID=3156617 RepID=UPI0032B45F42